jgi:hypothetical protein
MWSKFFKGSTEKNIVKLDFCKNSNLTNRRSPFLPCRNGELFYFFNSYRFCLKIGN